MKDQPSERVRVGPKDLACLVCGHDRFWRRPALLNTAGATYLGFDWANHEATCFVCERCSHVHWFAYPPKATQE